ncbi:hypothetical protein [Prochlorothrix hollandica]|nr:hypothetical protein [Prochlorothrix hollandica]
MAKGKRQGQRPGWGMGLAAGVIHQALGVTLTPTPLRVPPIPR